MPNVLSLMMLGLSLTRHLIVCLMVSAILALTTLNNGKQQKSGQVSNGLSWQATGVLQQGCTDSQRYPVYINDCYTLQLTSDPTQQLDQGHLDSPRQRIEFLTPGEADGTSFYYTFKHYLSSQTGTSNQFFSLMQILTRGGGATPVVRLQALKGQAVVDDLVRDCSQTGCPSIPIGQYYDRTTLHSIRITYGPNGSLDYVVSDAQSGKKLLSYSVKGYMGSGSTSLKFGTYRAAFKGMTGSLARVGDFTQRKL